MSSKINKYVIKVIKSRKNKKINLIVVSKSTDNFYYIEKLGNYNIYKKKVKAFINLEKVGYWLNKGAIIKQRPSWLVGVLYIKNKNE